jgi:hypothetical protein
MVGCSMNVNEPNEAERDSGQAKARPNENHSQGPVESAQVAPAALVNAWIAGYYHAGYTHDSYYAEVKAKEYAAAQSAVKPSPAQGENP